MPPPFDWMLAEGRNMQIHYPNFVRGQPGDRDFRLLVL